MKFRTVICLVPLIYLGFMPASGKTPDGRGTTPAAVEDDFNLAEFGAVGDGIANDGPALQAALNAIAAAGGGTLLVPAGRYAINTPVQKDFTGLDASLTILGVESSTPVPPPNASGQELTRGLDLTSEFAPRTGTQGVAIQLTGLQNFLIKDITFIGQPNVNTDAVITLALIDVWEATIRHCEFYGLSSLVQGGSVVLAVRSHLNLEQSVFLGSTGNSGYNAPVVQNLEWKGVTIVDAVFADYGQRAELWGKLGLAPPYSWVNIGNAAPPESSSPRREATIKNVFLDEGGFFGLSSTPDLAVSAPIDLIYVSGLYMNVTNLRASGNYLYGSRRVMIAKSHYGWSHNADAAIDLRSVGNAILDQVECVDSANRIHADLATSKLTVINSIYTFLDSQSPQTKVITTATAEDDPVQYVRQRFNTTLGRDPDAAAHFYWSDRLLQCGEGATCLADERAALEAYLGAAPVPTFSIAGRVTDETGAGLPNVTLTLSGSQSVTTQTGPDGRYSFDKLPTSGVYTVTANRPHFTINTPPQTITTPNGNRTLNFAATLNRHTITILINDAAGQAMTGVNVLLSSETEVTSTTDSSGRIVFAAQPDGESYTIVPTKDFYSFTPESVVIGALQADQTLAFSGTLATSYRLSGRLTANGQALSGATVMLNGPQLRSRTTDANGNYSFNVVAASNYTLTPVKTNYLFSPASSTFNNLSGNQAVNFEATLQSVPQFSAPTYNVSEGAGTVAISVNRTGDTSSAAEFVYSATDGSADQRTDVIPLIGTLRFAAGETTKSFNIFINDDSFVEGDENLTLELRQPGGATLSNSTATLTIRDNDSDPAATNPIDGAQFFVRQQYSDFLNRAPDAEGLAFWTNQITSCGTNVVCIAERRIDVSGAFFLSIEFQETGYLVYRLYRASFGQPPRHLNEFLLDTRTIGEGVVVNAPGWQELLDANRKAFIEDFVRRPQFIMEYPFDLTPVAFVNQLNAKAGAPLTINEAAAAVAEFAGAATSEDWGARARVLRKVADSQTLKQRELNPAFVLMQYFGYMQRNPDDAPDNSLDGYNFWLNKLEEFSGDFRRAEMVKSFLVSTEYRARFGAP
jgi:hypothetical protein